MSREKQRSNKRISTWAKSCLRKKKLKEIWADNIINKAEIPLRKYFCPHCGGFHLTKQI